MFGIFSVLLEVEKRKNQTRYFINVDISGAFTMTAKQEISIKKYNLDRTFVIFKLYDYLNLHDEVRKEDMGWCPVLLSFSKKITE
jgi:hypothetical protein